MAIALTRTRAAAAAALVVAPTATVPLPAAATARGTSGATYSLDCLHGSDTSPGTSGDAPGAVSPRPRSLRTR